MTRTADPGGDVAPGELVSMAAAVAATLFVLLLNAVPVASNDLWLQIKVGQLTMDNGAIPRTLLFPFTMVRGAAFSAHEWLPSILFFEWTRVFGEAGLMPLQALFALVQFGLSFVLVRRLSGSTAAGLMLATLAMLVVNYRYVLRPELFALLFFLLLLMLLSLCRRSGRRALLFWTLPLAVAWANCHGSFLLGPVVAGLFALGEGVQAAFFSPSPTDTGAPKRFWRAGWPYAAAAAGMLAASVANPRGAELLAFAFQVQGSEAIKSVIKEWLPTFHPLFTSEPAFWIFVTVAALSVLLLAASWRKLTVTDVLLFVAFGALALMRNRHIVWFAFADLAVCAHVLGRLQWPGRIEMPALVAVLVLALAGLGTCASFGNVRRATVLAAPSNNFTSVMVAELADPALSGNVLVSYELGAELIYRDWPRLKPSIDSRVDSYGDAYFLAHQHLFTDEAALRAFLEAYGVNHMLLLRRDFSGGIGHMTGLAAQWHVRRSDQKMLLLERNVPLPVRPS